MDIQTYLAGVRQTAERDLPGKWGIDENFMVFLKADFLDMVSRTHQSKFFNRFMVLSRTAIAFYADNIGSYAQIDDQFIQMVTGNQMIAKDYEKFLELNWSESVNQHAKKQYDAGYNVTIMFNPINGIKTPGALEGIADCVTLFCEMAVSKNIPFCIPHSVGHNYQKFPEMDVSRIIYFP